MSLPVLRRVHKGFRAAPRFRKVQYLRHDMHPCDSSGTGRLLRHPGSHRQIVDPVQPQRADHDCRACDAKQHEQCALALRPCFVAMLWCNFWRRTACTHQARTVLSSLTIHAAVLERQALLIRLDVPHLQAHDTCLGAKRKPTTATVVTQDAAGSPGLCTRTQTAPAAQGRLLQPLLAPPAQHTRSRRDLNCDLSQLTCTAAATSVDALGYRELRV